jgi:hypothetical protein
MAASRVGLQYSVFQPLLLAQFFLNYAHFICRQITSLMVILSTTIPGAEDGSSDFMTVGFRDCGYTTRDVASCSCNLSPVILFEGMFLLTFEEIVMARLQSFLGATQPLAASSHTASSPIPHRPSISGPTRSQGILIFRVNSQHADADVLRTGYKSQFQLNLSQPRQLHTVRDWRD